MAITPTEIENKGKDPLIVRTDEGLVEERPVSELIAADQYSALKTATVVPWGMRIARTKPPGSV